MRGERERRTSILTVRFTDEERALIKGAAEGAGRPTIADWLRSVVLRAARAAAGRRGPDGE